jgi:ribosomal protein L14E/L6E/L27E
MVTENMDIGQIVKSTQGRDKGQFFVVLKILSDDYVLIANGKTRKINNPKKKKIKHLMVYNRQINDIIEKLNQERLDDFFIKKSLAPFKKEQEEREVRLPDV